MRSSNTCYSLQFLFCVSTNAVFVCIFHMLADPCYKFHSVKSVAETNMAFSLFVGHDKDTLAAKLL